MFKKLLFILPLVYCKTLMIGDSLFANDIIKNQLEEWSNTQIHNTALIGSQLHNGWVESIPLQYSNYIQSNNIPTTIIMNGGGNDILVKKNDCKVFNNMCIKRINETTTIIDSLLKQMNNNGVLNVVYLGFYYINGLKNTVDYGTDKINETCNKAELNCHFIDIRNKSIPVSSDNLHPTDDGYIMLAENIWNTILNNNIELT